METGQKIIQSNNISEPINELSIQVNLSGLSFFVLNSVSSKIDYLESVNFDKKSNGKDKFQSKALPTELPCQVTEWSNISLYLLM